MTQPLDLFVNRFRDARILIAGEVGLDEYLWGDCYRISPEAPVPIIEIESQSFHLGLAANVAQNISSLAGRADLISVCGRDEDAKRLASMLDGSNIQHHLIEDSSRPTLRKVRIVAQKQHLVRVDFERTHPLDASTAKSFVSMIESKLADCDALIIQDYGKGVWNTDTVSIIDHARGLGKPVYVDPNRHSLLDLYRGVTLLTPNLAEAQVLCGSHQVSSKLLGSDDHKLNNLAQHILEKTGAEYSLVTCGEWGMVCLEKATGQFHRIPTFAREVFDVTGAGDTVIAVLALMHSRGAPIDDCMRVANAAAGLVVGRLGAASVTRSELLDELKRLENLALQAPPTDSSRE